MKRYEATLVHRNDGPDTLLAVRDGAYVLLGDVVGLVEKEIAEWVPAERSGSYDAGAAIDAMTALLNQLRPVATPTRADTGGS